MKWYCNKCKKLHEENELCPRFKEQLKKNPKLLSEAANFTTIAGQYSLISSQALDTAAQAVNRVTGSSFAFEGTKQAARDIHVFSRLNTEPFKRAGVFASPENAKSYLENVMKLSENSTNAMNSLDIKLTGYAQEADWLRFKQGQLSSLWEKSSLLNGNAKGIDGETINRFTGKSINEVTIKASAYAGENTTNNIKQQMTSVKDAIEKGHVSASDTIFGVKGTEEAARKVGLSNQVIEKNTPLKVSDSNNRLKDKMLCGQAKTVISKELVAKQMAQGAVVGAAVGLTVSSISNYLRYKNGEITMQEAFTDVSEDTLKGAITGAAMGGITLFLPAGPIGIVAGVAIGIYISKSCTNILDEIYGKGAYGAILDASGFVYGMSQNLLDIINKIEENDRNVKKNISYATDIKNDIKNNFEAFERMKGE